MIEHDYIMLIMNCKKYANKALYQKNTWLTLTPSYLIYYHVIGNELMDQDFKFDDDAQILWVKVADDYVSLPKKVIAAYNAVHKTFNYKHIFKTDDDQILVKTSFFGILPKLIENKGAHYGGYVVNVTRPYLSQYHKIHPELPQYIPILKTAYCSGRFYFLSNPAVQDLLAKRMKIENECLEDYAIGYYLADFFKKDMMNIRTNDFFTDIELSDFPQWLQNNNLVL
jgi:hypothetical protein